MNEVEALNLVNSDIALWEKAETTDLGGGSIEKKIHLPWGIGEVAVTLEGLTDGAKRRQALEQYGAYIRELVRDATDDDAITARAQIAAAKREQDDSGGSFGGHAPVPSDPHPTPSVVQGAGKAHEENVKGVTSLREGLVAQRDFFREQLGEYERGAKALRAELRALDAAIEAYEEDSDGTSD